MCCLARTCPGSILNLRFLLAVLNWRIVLLLMVLVLRMCLWFWLGLFFPHLVVFVMRLKTFRILDGHGSILAVLRIGSRNINDGIAFGSVHLVLVCVYYIFCRGLLQILLVYDCIFRMFFWRKYSILWSVDVRCLDLFLCLEKIPDYCRNNHMRQYLLFFYRLMNMYVHCGLLRYVWIVWMFLKIRWWLYELS